MSCASAMKQGRTISFINYHVDVTQPQDKTHYSLYFTINHHDKISNIEVNQQITLNITYLNLVCASPLFPKCSLCLDLHVLIYATNEIRRMYYTVHSKRWENAYHKVNAIPILNLVIATMSTSYRVYKF